jgi:aldehyde dehydrogenase (NAD+)
VALLRYYAGEAVRDLGEVIPAQSAGSLQFSLRQPVGVCALITPWNFPLAIPIWKAAPALAFGNTVVLKPSEMSGHVGHLLAETAQEAGVPNGVFNVIQGLGVNVGEPLLSHPEVRGMSFTGSQRVGLHLAQIAAAKNVKFQGEMGGKNVAIALKDADLDQAAGLIAGGAFRYAGQKCTATSRLVVVKDIAKALVDKVREQMNSYLMEPVTDPKCAIGPLISGNSRDRVMSALGSYAPSLNGSEGYFMPPVLVHDVGAEHDLAQQELFAPVLTVLEVANIDEALAVANGTPFGLSASLFTKDIASALRYLDQIEVGMVRVNGDTTGVDPHAPFGGLRGSSTHSREQGSIARDFYTDVKTVQINP